jgi:ribonuclease D
MMAIVRLRAAENNLSPVVLAPRKEIEHLVQNDVSVVNSSWRARMIGDELNAFINGELSLKVVDNQLHLVPAV